MSAYSIEADLTQTFGGTWTQLDPHNSWAGHRGTFPLDRGEALNTFFTNFNVRHTNVQRTETSLTLDVKNSNGLLGMVSHCASDLAKAIAGTTADFENPQAPAEKPQHEGRVGDEQRGRSIASTDKPSGSA